MAAPSALSKTSLRALWRSNRVLLTSGIALFVGLLILTALDIASRYDSSIGDSKRFAQSFSDLLAEHTARTFEAIDRTLRAADSIRLATRLDDPASVQAAKEALRSLHNGSPALVALGWTDAEGNVLVHTYDGDAVRPSVADLPHFRILRDKDQEGILIAPPFRSKASGKWISGVAIRFNDAEGHFAGIVTAPLDLSYFSRTFQGVRLGPHDSVALVGQNGKLLIREPYAENAMTAAFNKTPLFTEHIRRSDRGTFESESVVDGLSRIYSFRAVPGLPLVVLVSQAKSDALADWYGYLKTQLPIRLMLLLLIMGGTFVLARQNSLRRHQTDLLRTTLENMHEGLIVVDESDHIAMCNPRALKLLGLPADMMAARPAAQAVIDYQQSSGEFAQLEEDVRSRVRPKVVGEDENVYERRRPDGTVLEIRTVPFAHGGVIRTYLDVTAQRRAEEELARNERQFRMLTEQATDIIARIDVKARLRYVSPSCQRILGYAPDEMISMRILSYIHPDDVTWIKGFFAIIVATPSEWHEQRLQFRMRRKNGEWCWFEASPTPVLNGEGEVYEFVDVIRDISERKRLEAEAEAAKTQIEQAARVKSEFLASMSHELRTPLNGIIGFSGLVLEEPDLSAEVRRKVEHIQSASDGLLSIVNDVLDLSRIDEGRLEISPSEFTLADFVESTVSMIRLSAQTRGLDFRVGVGSDVAKRLVADTQRLRQILLNFLNNAVKFTPDGFVALDIAVAAESMEMQTLRFTVSDSGIGIPADKHERLFQRFSQVDQSIGREYGGSGLGLAITQRLADLMGGRIGFESEPGAGSKFWIELALPVAKSDHVLPAIEADNRLIAGGRLLLVEDLDINREIAVSILKRHDFIVDTASDGAEAIEAVKSKSYDLILMDIQMPRMDGLSATKAIRTLPAPAGTTPIVAMTANVLPTQVSEFLAAGMNDHVGKPFKPNELYAVVVCNIRQQASQQQAAGETLGEGSEVVSNGVVDELKSLMGAEQFDALLRSLADRLRALIERSKSRDYRALADDLHKLVSSAGMLGFQDASELFGKAEGEFRSGVTSEDLMEEVLAKSRTTLSEIKKLAAR